MRWGGGSEANEAEPVRMCSELSQTWEWALPLPLTPGNDLAGMKDRGETAFHEERVVVVTYPSHSAPGALAVPDS